MNLWCDIGNTRLKWQLEESGELIKQGAYVHHGRAEDFVSVVALESPSLDFIGFSSVQNRECQRKFFQALESVFSCEIKQAESGLSPLKLSCVYEDVSRFGVDRWLAMVASVVRSNHHPVCVVDAGSAVTLDFVDESGRHLGGYILPGIQMAISALLGKTHSVRFDNNTSDWDICYGTDTASSVKHGVLLQLVSVVENAWEEFTDSYSMLEPKLILTGGDARLLAPVMRVNFDVEDDLVLQGLRYVLNQPSND